MVSASTTAAHAFGTALKRARRAARLTQAELAERAGFSVVYISMLERGARQPQRTTLTLLADALALSSDERAAFAATAQAPDTARRQRSADPVGAAPPPVGAYLGALPAGQLVGRERELALVEDALAAVAGGQGRLLLVVGEPRVGKTRLAQEITIRARARGFRVFTGRCYEPQQHVAYFPFIEALAQAASLAALNAGAPVAERWPEVARLLPDDLASASAPPQRSDATAQQRLFWHVSSFVGTLAEQAPLALLLDDLQWADTASLDLMQHLARQAHERRVLLVATARGRSAAPPSPQRCAQ
jgi:transcriptional regulator with XRE-family HTH domain